MTTLDELQTDCLTLLVRALSGKTLYVFGEDGNGQYGRNDFFLRCHVIGVHVSMQADDQDHPSEIYSQVKLDLAGYDSEITGHAMTDVNLRNSLNIALQHAGIDPTCLDWADVSHQHRHSVTMNLDVGKLLDWA